MSRARVYRYVSYSHPALAGCRGGIQNPENGFNRLRVIARHVGIVPWTVGVVPATVSALPTTVSALPTIVSVFNVPISVGYDEIYPARVRRSPRSGWRHKAWGEAQ